LLQGLCFEHVLYPWRHAFFAFITSERRLLPRRTYVVSGRLHRSFAAQNAAQDDKPFSLAWNSLNLNHASRSICPDLSHALRNFPSKGIDRLSVRRILALRASCRETSDGVETTTAPVSGTVCTSDSAMSPVPGGRSTTM